MLCCVEETELATKSEHDIKILQQAISQLQLELRTTTKQARESQQPRVGIIAGNIVLNNIAHFSVN